MGNVCSLNTVYRACSSSVAFSRCSEDRWALQSTAQSSRVGFWLGVGCPACLCVYLLSLLEKERHWVTRLAADISVCGALWAHLSAGRGSRALRGRSGCSGSGRSAEGARRKRQVPPPPNKTTPRAAIALPAYELCSLQTFTFPDSKPSCQKFSFIFPYFFLLSSLKYFTNFNNCSL